MSMHCGREWGRLAFCGLCATRMESPPAASSEGRVVFATPALAAPAYADNDISRPAGDDDGAGTDFAVGALGLAVGLGVTAVTYAAAEPGGTFIVFYGPAIYGAWRILCGLFKAARV